MSRPSGATRPTTIELEYAVLELVNRLRDNMLVYDDEHCPSCRAEWHIVPGPGGSYEMTHDPHCVLERVGEILEARGAGSTLARHH